jgi:hypothetical protein
MPAEKIPTLYASGKTDVNAGTIQSVDGQSYQILGSDGCYTATPAFSCLVEPIEGDTVLFSINASQQCHVLSIIERTASLNSSIVFPGDVTFDAKQGQLHLNGKQGISISSQQSISQTSEEYTLIANKALFAIDNLNAIGSRFVANIKNLKTYADTVETVAANLMQTLKNSFRIIEGVDQTRAKDVIQTVKNLYSMRSRQAAILAEKDIKVDAERIHMG